MSQADFRSDSSSGISDSPVQGSSPPMGDDENIDALPVAEPIAEPIAPSAPPNQSPAQHQRPAPNQPPAQNQRPAARKSSQRSPRTSNQPPAAPPGKPSATSRAAANNNAGPNKAGPNKAAPTAAYGAVPPPPPRRATLPPVKPGPAIASVPSGVGSAKGVRWRGELESIQKRAETEKAVRRAAAIAVAHGQPPPPEASEYEDEHELTEEVVKSAPPWLISTIVHLVLLLVLALISSPATRGATAFILNFSQGEAEETVDLAVFSLDSNMDTNEQDFDADSEFDAEVPEVFEVVDFTDTTDIKPVDVGIGEVKIDIAKPMFGGRSGAMRKALLSIYGGTPQTEEAVALGLKWLKRNQRPDGGWSMQRPYSTGSVSENRTAATAMALLAFLGAGHTHKGGEYADVVEKGMKYLVNKQMDRQGFMAKSARGHEKMYAQAQATIALSELYGMTRDSWLRPFAQRALDFAEDAQSEEGGWRYEPRFDSDTSVTGWFVMALQSGLSAGLDVNDSKLRRVSGFLDTVANDDGATYSYQPKGASTAAMTAEGLLCRQYLGWAHEEPAMQRGVMALLDQSPFDINDRDVYYWYYATQVLHHYGGSPWRLWNDKMREDLPKIQIKSGKEAGSWAPNSDNWGRNYGRLYTTCLSIYCLEVYYRHMPLYKPEQQ